MSALAYRLARPDLRDFKSYASAFAEATGRGGLRLNANENPYAPLIEGEAYENLNRYPEPQPAALKGRLADLYGVQSKNILISRGTDEAIDLLMRAFCRPGEDSIVICPPTFGYYEIAARLQGAHIIEAPLGEDFTLHFDRLLAKIDGSTNVKLIFLCSPMNPTGGAINTDKILHLCDQLCDQIIIVDEAYTEFSSQESLSVEAATRDNLVVLRTLSKAYGLAGARCGGAVAAEATIELLSRIIAPYPLPTPTIHAALAALSPARLPIVEARIETIKKERERVRKRLSESPEVLRVYPSEANFIFFEARNTARLAETLRARGVRLRFRPDASAYGVRLTVGAEEENDIVLAALGVETTLRRLRRAELSRDTKETRIAVCVDLDAADDVHVATGVAFFDHMLEQVAKHGGFSLRLACEGDLDVDAHHTIEDCALAFGAALRRALGDKRGIGRYGFTLPMDEAAAEVLLDLSGRAFAVFSGDFRAAHIGAYPTEMTAHVFRSLADSLGAAIHVKATGENDHHKTEACFKALGRALRQAIRIEGEDIPSTKGALE